MTDFDGTNDLLPDEGAKAGAGAPDTLEEPEVSFSGADPRRTEFDINDLLEVATEREASDLIITVDAPPTMRLLGDLVPIGTAKLTPDDCAALLRQMLRGPLVETFERHGEVDFAYSVSGLGRYRVNGFLQRGSVAIAIRIIPPRVRTIRELGLPDVVASLARRPNGLILVTGPTGSGKSTTLAAMIDLMNTEFAYHIVTLEDPIEYLHHHKRSLVNQREVGKDTRTFATGLRSALRENPDVILVGELRDLETVSTALTAAETGHLVLSTLHTCDTAQTIDRIIDVFPPHQQDQIRVQLAGTLQGVLAQQLVKRADGRGRVAAFEILVVTPAIRNLIREGKTYQIPSLLQTGGRYGMKTLEGYLRDLVASGVITREEYDRRLEHLAESGAYVPGASQPGTAGMPGAGGYGGQGRAGPGRGAGGVLPPGPRDPYGGPHPGRRRF